LPNNCCVGSCCRHQGRKVTADHGLRCNVHRENGTVERYHVMSNAVEQEEGVQGARSCQSCLLQNTLRCKTHQLCTNLAIGPNVNNRRQANIALRLPTQPSIQLLSAECWVPSPPSSPMHGEEPRTQFYVLLVTAPSAITGRRIRTVSIPPLPPPLATGGLGPGVAAPAHRFAMKHGALTPYPRLVDCYQ
jgi:hypothetical protein